MEKSARSIRKMIHFCGIFKYTYLSFGSNAPLLALSKAACTESAWRPPLAVAARFPKGGQVSSSSVALQKRLPLFSLTDGCVV